MATTMRPAPLTRRAAIAALAVALPALSAGNAFGAPGDLDPGFGQNGQVTLPAEVTRALALQPDGRILAGGTLRGAMGESEGVVYRLGPSGSLDGGFGLGGAAKLAPTADSSDGLALQPDGRVLAVGQVASNGTVVRLDGNGSFDQTFGQGGAATLGSGSEQTVAVARQPLDGKIVVAGGTWGPGTGPFLVVYRLTAGGTLDMGFGTEGTVRIEGRLSNAFSVAVLPDGKILVAGFVTGNGDGDAVVYKLNPDGTLDDGFGKGGAARIDAGGGDLAFALAVQRDGKILVAGFSANSTLTYEAIVYRLEENGTPDASFGQGGSVRIGDHGTNVALAIALQLDGKILVAGQTTINDLDAVVYRLNPDGSFDSGFDGDGARPIHSATAAYAIAVQPDGKLVVAGAVDLAGTSRAVVYRLQGGDPVVTPPASTSPTAATPRLRAPIITRLRVTPPGFRAAAGGPSALPAGRRGGALVSFMLDRAAGVRFAFERAGRGRRAGGRCVKPTRANRGGRRCRRYVRLAGGFTRRGATGANSLRLTGRLSSRRLSRGSYRLVATPSADHLLGEAKRAHFRIKS